MTLARRPAPTLLALDEPTRELVRTAAVVAIGDESGVRRTLTKACTAVPALWIEELILQSYLFSGFPRALNAMREWRRLCGAAVASAPVPEQDWRAQGEATCRRVYGEMYDRLRVNIRGLHPALDDWMIVEGYGKVLSRPGLDLPRRELCIVAACAASRQERQLHSHLHGALNVGVAPDVVADALDSLRAVMTDEAHAAFLRLWSRVRGK